MKAKCKVFAVPDKNTENNLRYELIPESYDWLMQDDDIELQTVEVEYRLDDINEQEMVLKAIKTLKKRQERIIADAVVAQGKLQIKIDNLMLLEHKNVVNINKGEIE